MKTDLAKQHQEQQPFVGVGVDGCKGGWIVSRFDGQRFYFEKINTIEQIDARYPDHVVCIDMIMGLPKDATTYRPERMAKQLLGKRKRCMFDAPCRKAVYATSKEQAYDLQLEKMHQKLTPFGYHLIPKIKELDTWRKEHSFKPWYEAHPELWFVQCLGDGIASKKSEEGCKQRYEYLTTLGELSSLASLIQFAKRENVQVDDLLDAAILAYASIAEQQGKTVTLPSPMIQDEHHIPIGLLILAIKRGNT
ncbi:MAG: DUF429 domain-containing protein [Erysipelotrichaceae bacterium]